MRAIARAGVVLALLLAQPSSLPARAAADPSPAQTRPAPEFSEKDIFGNETIALRRYRGKVVVLNFWATWCSPCRAEIPALETLHRVHEGQVVVLGASVYSSDHDTEKFFRDLDVNYPVFYGSYELMEKYDRVATIPTTFIIDRNGGIAAKVIGARSREQYEELIRPLL